MKKSICTSLLIISLLSLLISSYENYPYYQVELGPIGGIALFCLWAWMLFDLIKNRNISKKAIWGIAFFIFNWVAAVTYFFKIFCPKEPQIEFIEKLKKQDNKTYNIIVFLAISLTLTILHQFFFSIFYITFGIPFPDAYDFVVNKIIYMPLSTLLMFLYNSLGVDTSVDPTRGVALFTHTATIAYTASIYLIVLLLGSKALSFKSKNKKCG